MPVEGMTHPETAAWIQAVPIALTVAAILGITLLFRGRLLRLCQAQIQRYLARHHEEYVDPALEWTPPVVTPAQLLGACVVAALVVLLAVCQVAPLYVAQVLSGSATALLSWLLLWYRERRYVEQLDSALATAVSRFAAQLGAANSFQLALRKVASDLPPSPLKTEWSFILDRVGAPTHAGGLATAEQVVAALAAQTPSSRHRNLLGHLETALMAERHDIIVARMEAAAEALHKEEQRRSAARTELARMRYGGVTVGSAGVLLGGYLVLTQQERVARAYSGTLGAVMAVIIVGFLILPLVGGYLLSRVDDLEY